MVRTHHFEADANQPETAASRRAAQPCVVDQKAEAKAKCRIAISRLLTFLAPVTTRFGLRGSEFSAAPDPGGMRRIPVLLSSITRTNWLSLKPRAEAILEVFFRACQEHPGVRSGPPRISPRARTVARPDGENHRVAE